MSSFCRTPISSCAVTLVLSNNSPLSRREQPLAISPNRIQSGFTAFTTTANFLATLGLQPAAGRIFNSQEDVPNGPRVAMISYGIWRSRFGSDPSIAGRSLNLDGTPTVITGVLPRDFLMPTLTSVDVLLPL